MSAANGTGGRDRAVVVGPFAVPGFVLLLVGLRQQRRLFVLLGAVLVGLAVKLVERSGTLGETEPPAESAEPVEPEPQADQPETA